LPGLLPDVLLFQYLLMLQGSLQACQGKLPVYLAAFEAGVPFFKAQALLFLAMAFVLVLYCYTLLAQPLLQLFHGAAAGQGFGNGHIDPVSLLLLVAQGFQVGQLQVLAYGRDKFMLLSKPLGDLLSP
jgi:hypothetical protein